MRAPKASKAILSLTLAAILIGAGVAVGWKIGDQRTYDLHHQYPLLDPSVNNPDVHQEVINFDPLRQDLKKYLASLNMSHSFYFEYLPNGSNIRDGADNYSEAASLMKTPMIMDLYKLSETGRLDLNQTVTVQAKDINNDSDYGDPTNLKVGDELTLRQAAQITLHYSDNTTLNVVSDKVLPLLTDSTDSIQSLDISYSTTSGGPGGEQVTISSLAYSSVLKCLYYACFNTPQDSTAIINDLTGAAESGRLQAGAPYGVPVAHKVGSSPVSQSDCGIIYLPSKPYLICLMFFNIPSSIHNIDQYFQKVSQMIYDYVSTSGATT